MSFQSASKFVVETKLNLFWAICCAFTIQKFAFAQLNNSETNTSEVKQVISSYEEYKVWQSYTKPIDFTTAKNESRSADLVQVLELGKNILPTIKTDALKKKIVWQMFFAAVQLELKVEAWQIYNQNMKHVIHLKLTEAQISKLKFAIDFFQKNEFVKEGLKIQRDLTKEFFPRVPFDVNTIASTFHTCEILDKNKFSDFDSFVSPKMVLSKYGIEPDIRSWFVSKSLNDKLEIAENLLLAKMPKEAAALLSSMTKNEISSLSVERQENRLFLLGRSWNGADNPAKAAENYKAVFTQFPKGELNSQAKNRYLLSLHYSKRYGLALKEWDKLQVSKTVPKILNWKPFWWNYWTKNYIGASRYVQKKLKVPGDQLKAKFWLAQVVASQGAKNIEAVENISPKAFEVMQELALPDNSSAEIIDKGNDTNDELEESNYYHVLARGYVEYLQNYNNSKLLNSNSSINVNVENEVAQNSIPKDPIASDLKINNGQKGNLALKAKNLSSKVEFNTQFETKVYEKLFSTSNSFQKFEEYRIQKDLPEIQNADRSVVQEFGVRYLNAQGFDQKRNVVRFLQEKNIYHRLGQHFKSNSLASLPSSKVSSNVPYWVSHPVVYPNLLKKISAEFQLNPVLLLSIAKAESEFDDGALSPVGARGLLQLMPSTGAKIAQLLGFNDFHENDLFLPEVNLTLGAAYLARLNAHFNGHLPLVIAAYNAGPVAVQRWVQQTPNLPWSEFVENIPFEETQNYVKKVLKNMDTYYKNHLDSKYGFAWSETLDLPNIKDINNNQNAKTGHPVKFKDVF